MKKKFNKIFLKSIRIINWFESPGFLGMQKAGNILFVIFIFVGSLLHFLKGVSALLNNILFGLLIVILYSLFFLLSLRFYWIKPPKFIRRTTENPGQLFDIWGHWPYLYGIMIYSFFASFFMGGILLAIMHIILELNFNFSKIYYTLFFLTAATFSVFYFMYHVSVKDISTKVVKARIRLYLAIAATITAGLFGLSLKEITMPLITYLGIGFAWLSFFVEKIESEG